MPARRPASHPIAPKAGAPGTPAGRRRYGKLRRRRYGFFSFSTCRRGLGGKIERLVHDFAAMVSSTKKKEGEQ
ncbi:MAG TPA: hypothetical protein VGR48_12430 [Terriglobales bacterium]|nr:hypothetical protein [Terriglobales bacterium]